ncbi:hypothetical protein SDC9_157898 [bioreactor metagenome]|uniref:Uncharacterized protein n=1 Tax=bioreactor metagenome TaxID=1076179 RepID=A0A645FDY9_9ZZZZ
MDEAHLLLRHGAERKRVGVDLPQAARQAVEQQGGGHQRREHALEGRRRHDERIDHREMLVAQRAGHVDLRVEALGCLQQVHQVQVVRPGFGPVLPRVGGGIGADVGVVPVLIGDGRARVVVLQRLSIVLAFVAEQCTEIIEPRAATARDQRIPEIVADLVA